MELERNLGFDGRVFLHEADWQAYRRRKPVRYIRHLKATKCERCGLAATTDNPLQNAHIVSFDMGVIELALTPEFLDSRTNIVTAHRCTCNKGAELSLADAMRRLQTLGITGLPSYLPA